MLRAARGNPIRAQASAQRRVAIAALALIASSTAISAAELGVFHHARPDRPFLTTPHGDVTPREAQWSPEESRMRALRSSALVVGSSLAITSGALAQDAVQWRVEDGGNGHWYQGVPLNGTVSWQSARTAAEALGAHLATITTVEELSWIINVPGADAGLWNDTRGPYIGGEQLGSGRLDGWRWVTDEPWFPLWGAADCGADDYCNADALTIGRCNSASEVLFNDWPKTSSTCTNYSILGAIIEWSADCNADGVVDYGQIRAGELPDTNSNNIPDCCEGAGLCLPCRADVDQSGAVNGVDLAAVLNNWATSGGKQPRSDVNSDGIVDGADLAEVLNSWGACQ